MKGHESIKPSDRVKVTMIGTVATVHHLYGINVIADGDTARTNFPIAGDVTFERLPDQIKMGDKVWCQLNDMEYIVVGLHENTAFLRYPSGYETLGLEHLQVVP